jgi:hypothetical protein
MSKSRYSSISIVSGYGLGDLAIEVWSPAEARSIFLLTSVSRPSLGPTQPPVQWVPGPFPEGKAQSGHDVDHSPPTSAEFVNVFRSHTSSPPVRLHGCDVRLLLENVISRSWLFGSIIRWIIYLYVGLRVLNCTFCFVNYFSYKTSTQWKQYAPLKRRSTSARQHDSIFQKAVMFKLTAVRTWNLNCIKEIKNKYKINYH